jgi:tRNA 2-selenouridine synthase
MVLGQIGFKICLIEGGYKAFRAALLASIPELVAPLQWRVVCGPTGSGKTRLLHALAAEGAQVLDLEDLANHRSSVLGHIPGSPQPSQKHFDTLVWRALRSFDPKRPVYVESESRKVGNLSVPEVLMLRMRESPCLHLQLSDDERVALLLEDYDFFVKDPDYFCKRLEALAERRGRAVVEAWKSQVMAGHNEAVVRELLTLHYDPGYAESTRRNFTQFGQATVVQPSDRSMDAMRALAREVMRQQG